MGSVCQRRAPEELKTQGKKVSTPKPEPSPKAAQASQKPNTKKYDIDYSKWAQLEDSDEEVDAANAAAAEVAAKEAQENMRREQRRATAPQEQTMTRWSGKGANIFDELKALARRSAGEMKIKLGKEDEEKPKDVALPKDFKKDVGVLTAKELNKYGCDSNRILVSVYGDIFDVSDRPDLYASGEQYAWRSGKDITWSIVSGTQSQSACNKFYDYFKLDVDHMQRYLQLICQFLSAFEDDFGDPVGMLAEYKEDRSLPVAPADQIPDCKQQ